MTPARAARVACALAAAAMAAACQRAVHGAGAESRATVPGSARAPAPTDSLEGIVRVVGVEAFPQVVLALDSASPAVSLDGPASLRRVAGLRVAVVGERSGARLAVRRFIVLAANGVPATDGMLAADGDALLLVTSDGTRHRLVNPPPLLRSSIGHRAWVSGALDRELVAYGIIE